MENSSFEFDSSFFLFLIENKFRARKVKTKSFRIKQNENKYSENKLYLCIFKCLGANPLGIFGVLKFPQHYLKRI